MTCLRVEKIKSWVKVHHTFNYKDNIDEKPECLGEPNNQHSEHVISVCLKKINHRMKFIGHIPDVLAKLVDGLMLKWRTTQVIDKSNGKHRDAPWETQLSGSGILIPWIYILYGAKIQKKCMKILNNLKDIKHLKKHQYLF